MKFIFKHKGNILSINFDKGGNLFYEKNLKKIDKYDLSSMLNKAELENSEIINEYENINEKQDDIETKYYINLKLEKDKEIIIKISINNNK